MLLIDLGLKMQETLSCHQLHTVALSFLPYAAGKQQLDGKMPKIRHFHFNNCSQRDNCFRYCGVLFLWKYSKIYYRKPMWLPVFYLSHDFLSLRSKSHANRPIEIDFVEGPICHLNHFLTPYVLRMVNRS